MPDRESRYRTWPAIKDFPAPGKAAIAKRYRRFMADLPATCSAMARDVGELTFTKYADAVSTWLQRELSGPRS